MSKTPTWEEILARIYELEKRLNLLEKKIDIKPSEEYLLDSIREAKDFDDLYRRLKEAPF